MKSTFADELRVVRENMRADLEQAKTDARDRELHNKWLFDTRIKEVHKAGPVKGRLGLTLDVLAPADRSHVRCRDRTTVSGSGRDCTTGDGGREQTDE
jgi:hypothetical protein